MGLESPSARAERLARYLTIWDRVPTLAEATARIDAVTRADVLAYAEGLVGGADTALALYGPVGAAPDAGRDPRQACRLMLMRRRRVRIETERMTLRLPTHSDYRALVGPAGGKPRLPGAVGAGLGRGPSDAQGLHQPRLLGGAGRTGRHGAAAVPDPADG